MQHAIKALLNAEKEANSMKSYYEKLLSKGGQSYSAEEIQNLNGQLEYCNQVVSDCKEAIKKLTI